ncbi:DUF636 domain protein [Xylogone sp. PMI_703]|nr:DUF636 domain protein [Xylogone sp. PMI_703]
MTTKTLTARCHCKSTHFTLTIPTSSLPLKAHLCHCSICRYTHGSFAAFHAPLPAGTSPSFIAPSSLANLTAYVSSNPPSQRKRYFCSTCGCHAGDCGLNDEDWTVSTSIFDENCREEGIWEWSSHIYTDSAKEGGIWEWIKNVRGKEMEVYPFSKADGKNAKHQELSKEESPGEEQEEEKLHASCHCGGISFTLSRPTPALLSHPEYKTYISPLDPTKYVALLDPCSDCRLVTGTHFIIWTLVPISTLSPSLPPDLLPGTAKMYYSSPGVKRIFCGVCGATVFGWWPQRPEIIDVAVGLFRDGSAGGEDGRLERWFTWRTGRIGFEADGEEYDEGFMREVARGFRSWGMERNGVYLDFSIG